MILRRIFMNEITLGEFMNTFDIKPIKEIHKPLWERNLDSRVLAYSVLAYNNNKYLYCVIFEGKKRDAFAFVSGRRVNMKHALSIVRAGLSSYYDEKGMSILNV
jgi:hypothetical protein